MSNQYSLDFNATNPNQRRLFLESWTTQRTCHTLAATMTERMM